MLIQLSLCLAMKEIEQGAMGTNWSLESSIWTRGRTSYFEGDRALEHAA